VEVDPAGRHALVVGITTFGGSAEDLCEYADLHFSRTRTPQLCDALTALGYSCTEPLDAELKLLLGSGLVRGVGPRLADAIVRQFGEDTLTVIDTTPRKPACGMRAWTPEAYGRRSNHPSA
jgi:hypothetical protein